MLISKLRTHCSFKHHLPAAQWWLTGVCDTGCFIFNVLCGRKLQGETGSRDLWNSADFLFVSGILNVRAVNCFIAKAANPQTQGQSWDWTWPCFPFVSTPFINQKHNCLKCHGAVLQCSEICSFQPKGNETFSLVEKVMISCFVVCFSYLLDEWFSG